ncbi:MAG: VCBS repeat-containing protein [Bryobacteraceae bacterium]
MLAALVSIVIASTVPAGDPVSAQLTLPANLDPDSVRVSDAAGVSVVPKLEWRVPDARLAWISTGSPRYEVRYAERDRATKWERQTPPAMIGAGDRVTYGRPRVRGKLSVGLWPHPGAIDWDEDGDLDLIIGCNDRPYNGIYLFLNIGSNDAPLFDRAEWLGPSRKDLVIADFNGDGAPDLVISGGYFSDVRRNRLTRWVPVAVKRDYWVGRDDLWYPADWDGDGRIDVLNGVSDWRDYGWDDAFDAEGRWQRGPLHGYVWLHRNVGTNELPRYADPVLLTAGGKSLDLYGSPAPNPVDWFGKGRLDLVGGSFVDTLTVFRRDGSVLDAGKPLAVGGKTFHMDLCMIQPRVVQWDRERGPSLLVSEEDGRVVLLRNRAGRGAEPDLAPPQYLMQVDPYLKSGALSRPVSVDWNGDGKLDIVAGNSAGYIQWFENVGTVRAPAFEDRGYLEAGGRAIRRVAGPNGSVQGPAEEKWGYSNPWVADWDLDGDLDLLVNDIWGSVVWYRNAGTRTKPVLEAAADIEVEWAGRAPKPDWVWWEPKGKQLVTQWRTTPRVVDWDRDGLPDLVMLNHQGYLALFRRARRDGKLVLLPPERIFVDTNGRFLNLALGRAGRSGRRKIETVDWDRDGDLDLILDGDEGPVWWENVGSQARPVMKERGRVLEAKLPGHNPTPNAADWDGDGKLDLLIGAEDGFFYFFKGK